MIRQELKEILEKAAKEETGMKEIPQHVISVPPRNIDADYASNISMVLAGRLRKPPLVVAEAMAGRIESGTGLIEKVKVEKPGFINLYVSAARFYGELSEICKKEDEYGRTDTGKGEKIQIEFVSANPTGPLHIGHGRGAAIGDTLANILEVSGYDVTREYYVNNMGNQVNLLGESVLARKKEMAGEEVAFPEGGYEGEYIKDVAKELPQGTKDAKDYAVKKILEWIRENLEKFGVAFDSWFFESTLYEEGKRKSKVRQAIDTLKQKGHIYERDGAVWFHSSSFGDEKDRVIIKKDGTPTYLASDIAYHYDKFEKGFERLINIWGADHHGYVDRIKGCVSAMGHNPEKLKIILYQLVSLTREGKPVAMSTRKGEFVTLKTVLDEVGKDACRFFFLMRGSDSQLDFDLELAKKQSSENPVYYVQYAHARISSIFREAEKAGIGWQVPDMNTLALLKEKEELGIIKKLAQYPELLLLCSLASEPHHLTLYLQELVGEFHRYYDKFRILNEDRDLTAARLSLVRAVRIVIKNALTLLGISSPERM